MIEGITYCGVNQGHSLVLIGISLGYYLFAFQLVRLVLFGKGVFEANNVKMVCLLLALVFIFCGNSKWLGCGGHLWNDLPLLLFQYGMITIIEYNFTKIKGLKSQEAYEDLRKNKDSEIHHLVEQVFAGEDVKNWFFHQSLNGSINNKGHFVMLSDKWEHVLGWTKQEMTSRPFIEFVHPEDRERTLDVYNKGDKADYKGHFINRYQHKDGSYVTLKWPNETKKLGENIFTFKAEVNG